MTNANIAHSIREHKTTIRPVAQIHALSIRSPMFTAIAIHALKEVNQIRLITIVETKQEKMFVLWANTWVKLDSACRALIPWHMIMVRIDAGFQG